MKVLKSDKKLLYSFCLVFCFLIASPVFAQNPNQPNFSTIRVDELSDEQIRNFMRQVEATGLKDAQLEQVAQARGMKPEEVVKLRRRVEALKLADKKKLSPAGIKVSGSSAGAKSDTSTITQDTTTLAEKALLELKSKIFGADLFKNKQITFEPNLRLATPMNYQIGPDDVLKIELYGYSEVAYSLKVSPEGSITIPNIGVVSLVNTTIEQAIVRIKARMSTLYADLRTERTSLNVTIENIRTIKVIITGEIENPGTYSLPSVSTIFNSLYASGGPTENGSFRAIQIIRAGKKIATIDVYDFLINGDIKSSIRLQDQDVILVPNYKNRVEVVGEVKRPRIFEIIPGESLTDLLRFAGDFTERAYKSKIKVLKTTDNKRAIEDVLSSRFDTYKPQSGDKYYVDAVLERYTNRVTIEGAVYRPGEYELEAGASVISLIKKAEGLRDDAFTNRAYIKRLKDDLQTEIVSFDLAKVLTGVAADISLKREDIISVSSIFDLQEEYKISIYGEVIQPDSALKYLEGMNLGDAIMQAGGFTDAATPKKISVSRRVRNSNVLSLSASTAQVFEIDINRDLKQVGENFKLEPYDIIVVRATSGYEIQRQMTIQGEVLYPGSYTITKKDERISSVIQRSGGLTALAYPEGASLRRILKKEAAPKKNNADSTKQVANIPNDYVGIDLVKILANPGGVDDIFLEENDILFVSKQLQTVTIQGEISSPVTTAYRNNKGFKYYISSAGGFTLKAAKRRSYVRYANGSTKSAKKFLLFNVYPSIKPGSEIFVPENPTQKPFSITELVSITTSLLTLYLLINTVTK
jgi:protein involved in polysaccharide export with SLBB domain